MKARIAAAVFCRRHETPWQSYWSYRWVRTFSPYGSVSVLCMRSKACLATLPTRVSPQLARLPHTMLGYFVAVMTARSYPGVKPECVVPFPLQNVPADGFTQQDMLNLMNMGVMEGYFINFANTTGSNTQGVLHTKFVVADHSGSKALEFVAFAYFIGMLVPAMFTYVPGMSCYMQPSTLVLRTSTGHPSPKYALIELYGSLPAFHCYLYCVSAGTMPYNFVWYFKSLDDYLRILFQGGWWMHDGFTAVIIDRIITLRDWFAALYRYYS